MLSVNHSSRAVSKLTRRSLFSRNQDDEGCTVVKKSKVRCYKYYDVCTENMVDKDDNEFVELSAYTKNGDYIGPSVLVYRLVHVHGVTKFEKAYQADAVCSIGFSQRDHRYYGWFRKAIHGFGIGSNFNGHYASTLSESKKLAAAFARSIV